MQSFPFDKCILNSLGDNYFMKPTKQWSKSPTEPFPLKPDLHVVQDCTHLVSCFSNRIKTLFVNAHAVMEVLRRLRGEQWSLNGLSYNPELIPLPQQFLVFPRL